MGMGYNYEYVSENILSQDFIDLATMTWIVQFEEDFEREFDSLPPEVQDILFAKAAFLEEFGPELGRPHVDTLQGSEYANMKELRFNAMDGVWRVAFAFDPLRRAMLLVAGDKSGVSQKRFYQQLIKKADRRFTNHLNRLEEEKN
jgi:hypothetical protein